jgi:hypothetical protein
MSLHGLEPVLGVVRHAAVSTLARVDSTSGLRCC